MSETRTPLQAIRVFSHPFVSSEAELHGAEPSLENHFELDRLIPVFTHAGMNAPNFGDWMSGLSVLLICFIGFAFFVLYMLVKGAICFSVIHALRRVPAEHRRIEPAMVWLLLIPCFSVVWNFFVYQRVPASFNAFFESRGRNNMGDCGKGVGLAYAIVELFTMIPFAPLSGSAWIAGWVLLIISLVRFNELASQVVRELALSAPPSAAPVTPGPV